MFNAFLDNIIHKSHKNSVDWPVHKAKVHDIMKAVDAIDFTTPGVIFCTINLE